MACEQNIIKDTYDAFTLKDKYWDIKTMDNIAREVEPDRDRYRREVHERVTTAPARASKVGPGAHHRVAQGIDTQGDEYSDASKGAGQPQHLVIVEQQEEAESGGLNPLR